MAGASCSKAPGLGKPKFLRDNQLAAKRPKRTRLPITSSAMLPALAPRAWCNSRVGDAGKLPISTSARSISLSGRSSSSDEEESSERISWAVSFLACAIARVASAWEEMGTMATFVTA